jgi:hypothetical protein
MKSQVVFDAIRALMEEPEKPRRKKIGFEVKEPKAKYMKKLCVVDIMDVI